MALQSLSRAASLGQLARVTALAVPAPVSGVNLLFFDLLLYGLAGAQGYILQLRPQIFSYNFSNILVA